MIMFFFFFFNLALAVDSKADLQLCKFQVYGIVIYLLNNFPWQLGLTTLCGGVVVSLCYKLFSFLFQIK